MNIDNMSPKSGRIVKENSDTVNLADILADVYDENNNALKTTAQLGDIAIDNVSIKDKDNAYYIKVNSNGSIDANVTLPAGDNNIGNVDVVTLPALPSGTNKIGSVNIRNNANDANIDPLAEATFTARVGEVQAEPTANTILGRLKALLTGISLASGTNKIGSVNIRNNANDANIDPLAETTFTARLGEVQTTPTSNTVLARLKDLLTGISLASSANRIGQTGYTLKKISVPFTRPSDTTTYAVGDAVTNSTSSPTVFEMDLASIGAVVGQSFEVRKLVVVSSVKQSLLPLFNVYLSPTTFTATNDNSPLDIADATQEAGGAWFQCDTQNYTASNSRVANTGIHEPMVLASNDTKVYGSMQAGNAYIPVSGEKFTIIAWVALL